MIVTTDDQWTGVYTAIREESRKSDEKHIFIYASASDADSVCALRILERLFQNDLIPHGWMAVSRYAEIMDDFLQHYKENETAMRTIVLLNCGAAEDMNALLDLGQRNNVRVVIIDSHRPIMHLANVDDAADNLIVFLDESEGTFKADIPLGEREEDAESDEDGDMEEEEESDEGEGSGAEEDGQPPAQRRRLENGIGAAGGRRLDARRAARQERRQRLEQRETYYQQGAFYGKPAACIIFDLAYCMGQESSYMAWLALVGLTDHMVHNRISQEKYLQYVLKYETWLASKGHFDPLENKNAVDGGAGPGVAAAVTGRIAQRDDFRFGLLWEWNLYDAMMYSPYVAARLNTFTEKGRIMLDLLLAKMGIPLQQARSAYKRDLRPRLRDQLPQRLAAHGPEFKLTDAMFKSFQLQDGHDRCVTAVDAVHAATALLECSGRDGGEAAGSSSSDADHVDRFWNCYYALSPGDDRGNLRRGLDLAKKLQRALVSDGGSVLSQRLYHNFKAFRMYDMADHRMSNHHLLCHPMALQRLAAFFQDEMYSRTGRRRPVVVIAPRNPDTGRCLVVGYGTSQRLRGNKLGAAFSAASEKVGARAWHDLFDTCVVEVTSSDVERFKSELLRMAGSQSLLA